MFNKSFWKKVFDKQTAFDVSRFKIIKESGEALQCSKKAIFAFQRGRADEAEVKLQEARAVLKSLEERFGKDFRLRMEGSWKSAMEEFCEAKLFGDFYKNEKLDAIKEFHVEPDEYLGGLTDVTGEIVRMMIIWTTQKEFDKVRQANEVIHDIVEELMEYNFVGYLRTKFDQAKNSLRKAEEIVYDISLRD